MTETSAIEKLYDALKESIDALVPVRESLKRETVMLKSWTDFVMQNEAEIVKFGKVTDDFQAWLATYDFAKGLRFDEMQRKLQELHSLRLKLVKMGENAKKLAAYPDRYNSRKAVEVCRDLTFTCMERMTLDEIDKVGQLVDKNTQKLIELQRMFERDGDILSQIKSLVEDAKSVLVKFKAYYSELQQYVAEFPHAGQDDMSTVKSRIATAKQIDDLYGNADKAMKLLTQNITNTAAIPQIAKYQELFANVKNVMRSADAGTYKLKLGEVANGCATLMQINEAIRANKITLEKYKSYNAEVLQYMQFYPHDNQDDLAVVKNMVFLVKQIDSLAAIVGQEVAVIRDFSDRHGKAAVVAECIVLLQSVVDNMHYSDARDFEVKLNGILSRIRSVKDAFGKELLELKALNTMLQSRVPIVWKEDGERMLYIVLGLLNRGPERTDFDLQGMKVSFSDARIKRATDIDSKRSMYPWLESKKRYKTQHDNLVSRYITLGEYNAAVNKLKWDKILRLILLCIPVIGWIVLFNMKDVEV